MHLAILGMVRCPVAPGSCAPPTALLCSSYSVSLSARQVDAACVRVWGVGGCGLWMCGGVGIYLLGSLLRLVFFSPFLSCVYLLGILLGLVFLFFIFFQAFISLVIFCFLFRGTFLPMKYKKIVDDRQFFSKVLHTVTLYSRHNRALTFQEKIQRRLFCRSLVQS